MALQSKEKKDEFRNKLKEDVVAFLKKGGKIKKCTSFDNLGAATQLRPSKNRKGMVYAHNLYSNFSISGSYKTSDKQILPRTKPLMSRRAVK
mgnify:FL=1|tara:strand:+ start:213 stop:488 length:276 start_codon:yes stop_codon:yes gene_type:complete